MTPRSFAAFAASLPLCFLATTAHALPGMATSALPQEKTADAATPDSTISFSLKEVGGGLGYEWGKGSLHHNGRDYAFEIGGGGIASLGYITVKGTGTVKDLARLDQFDGTYWTVKADAAIGSGVGAAVLENQYGVKLNLTMSIKGAHVGASVMRLRFRLLPDKTEKLAAQ
ncbi:MULTISPECIES: hypothetical protein [Asaia]|uniref:hypothetical protein n=1 Tax=Asaia TaxID=91914 RepID=UPI002552F1BC|nr:hypothetical protein [Asaia sp. HumB]MDL2171621.1 hypothetical protein [Asaia sp. HumB]